MLAGVAGLEPTHTGVKVLCLTDLATPQNEKMGWVTGFEPAKITEPQSAVLGQLHHTHRIKSIA